MSYYQLLSALPNGWRIPMAFDPGKSGWKLDKDGKVETKDGNPIWIDANGAETTLSGDTITRLNGEAKQLRLAKEAAETTLATFKDIDPVAAKKAIETMKNIDAKKLIDAGEVEKVRNEISQQFTVQLGEKDKAIGSLSSELDNLRINNIFAQSDFIRDNIAVPRDMFEAAFVRNFKIVDGKPQAFDKAGNRIMSKKNMGDYADPAEALEILVDQHPQKATILKAPNHSGGGNNGGGGNRGGTRVMKRSDFEQLPASQAATAASEMAAGKLTIAD
jgi:hypothetical protein